MNELLIGYARVSTSEQDLTAQRLALAKLGGDKDHIYVDHGLTGTNRERPGLRIGRASSRTGGCDGRWTIAAPIATPFARDASACIRGTVPLLRRFASTTSVDIDRGVQVAQRVFVSFDYDNDSDLKTLLIGQARNTDSPFAVEDWSVKTASAGWKADARNRISRSDQVIALCGRHTHTATGVNVELELARELGVPYFLLKGRDGASRPTSALPTDKLYDWTWPNLKSLIAGNR